MESTAVSSPATSTAPRYVIDASHSHVGFSVRHMMISNVRGEFQRYAGEFRYDPARPEATSATVSIEVASVNTREEKRDGHLRSGDFFDAEAFPTMTFTSKGATARGDGIDLVGDLTIRGTTREVVLSVDDITAEHKDPWGNLRVGATATTKIKRSDFGMVWNAALEAGGVLVADEVKIQLEVEGIKQA
ncbi:MAG: YceI family protein [Polyangiales bacterium]